jgi:RimJ/RimL family protein N-acetyltransferase
MTPTFITARLILQPLTLDDAPTAQLLFPHWEIVRYLAAQVPWPYPPDGVLTYYRDHVLPAMQREEEWHWSLRLKSDPMQMIGSIALVAQGENNRGFWIGHPWQRQGYITEACEPVTDFWFNTLGMLRLRVPKAIANIASRRISEKQNMHLVRVEDKDYVSGRLPSELWELTAEDWNARTRDPALEVEKYLEEHGR